MYTWTGFYRNREALTIISLLCFFVLTGCGSPPTPRTIPPTKQPFWKPEQTPSASPSSKPTDPESTRPKKGIPPLSLRVGTIGYKAVTVEVKTGKILKIQFTPGRQDQTVEGTGFSPIYSRLGVYLIVGSSTQPTPMLSNGLMAGGTAETSPILDFSTALPCSTGTTKTETCRESVSITVDKPNYDYWCLATSFDGCPWAHVHSSHPWNGSLMVETDDTDPLE